MKTVLIVDDDAMIRQFLTDAFAEFGLRAVTADGAAAALDLVARGQIFDLVVADLVMAGRNGDQLIADLRALGFGQPMYLLTGRVGSVECAGATALLRKPVRFDDLEKVARGAL